MDRELKEILKPVVKTLVLLILVGPLISLYTTFVLQHLWNWFATEALNLPAISFWVMYGLVLMIGMFTSNYGDKENEYSFKSLAIALDACVPEDKREDVLEQLDDQQRSIWQEIGLMPFWRILGATFTLVLGWAVHTFLL